MSSDAIESENVYPKLSFTDENTMNIDISSESKRNKTLNDYRRNGQFCDITINVEGGRIMAHKVILAVSIPYFHLMFTLDMKESKMDEVDIPGIEYKTMKQLIEYAYTGKMEISTDNVQSIITSAHYLQLTDLVDYCSWFLTRQIDQNNCFGIRRLFKQLALNKYVQAATDYIRSSFLSISKQDGFIELDTDELVELLSCDQLYTDNEYDVLDRSMLWLRAKQGRQQYIDRISQCIRIPSANQLILSLLTDSNRSEESLTHTLNIEPVTDCFLKPRNCQKWILTVLSDYSNDEYYQQGYIYDPIMKTKIKVDGMKFDGRDRIKSVSYHKRRLISVNEAMSYALSSVEMFDFDRRKWIILPTMNRTLFACTATVVGNNLYVIGIYDRGTELEILDLARKEWREGPSMNGSIEIAQTVVIGKYIYVLGMDSPTSRSVARFDTEQEIWEFVAPMIFHKRKFVSTEYNVKIYVVGGEEYDDDGMIITDTMEVYDPNTDSWSKLTTNTLPKSILSLVSTHEGIYAVAKGLHLYNVEKNEWTTVNNMILGWGLSCAIPVSPYGK